MNPDLSIEEPVSLSMVPYTGAWTKSEAAHLLRRTMFGATNQQILDARWFLLPEYLNIPCNSICLPLIQVELLQLLLIDGMTS